MASVVPQSSAGMRECLGNFICVAVLCDVALCGSCLCSPWQQGGERLGPPGTAGPSLRTAASGTCPYSLRKGAFSRRPPWGTVTPPHGAVCDSIPARKALPWFRSGSWRGRVGLRLLPEVPALAAGGGCWAVGPQCLATGLRTRPEGVARRAARLPGTGLCPVRRGRLRRRGRGALRSSWAGCAHTCGRRVRAARHATPASAQRVPRQTPAGSAGLSAVAAWVLRLWSGLALRKGATAGAGCQVAIRFPKGVDRLCKKAVRTPVTQRTAGACALPMGGTS